MSRTGMEDARAELKGILDGKPGGKRPRRRASRGEAVVREVTGAGAVAVCEVTSGAIYRDKATTLIRAGQKPLMFASPASLSRDRAGLGWIDLGEKASITLSGVTFKVGDIIRQ